MYSCFGSIGKKSYRNCKYNFKTSSTNKVDLLGALYPEISFYLNKIRINKNTLASAALKSFTIKTWFNKKSLRYLVLKQNPTIRYFIRTPLVQCSISKKDSDFFIDSDFLIACVRMCPYDHMCPMIWHTAFIFTDISETFSIHVYACVHVSAYVQWFDTQPFFLRYFRNVFNSCVRICPYVHMCPMIWHTWVF